MVFWPNYINKANCLSQEKKLILATAGNSDDYCYMHITLMKNDSHFIVSNVGDY